MNTTSTTRPGASPETTTTTGGKSEESGCASDSRVAPAWRGRNATSAPGGARWPSWSRFTRPLVVPLDVLWAVSLLVVLVVAVAYELGVNAGVVDGYWQCAGELGVVG